MLAACDPANPYGAALPWPLEAARVTGPVARPVRWWCWSAAHLGFYVERGGKGNAVVHRGSGAAGSGGRGAWLEAVKQRLLGKLTVERADGAVFSSAE